MRLLSTLLIAIAMLVSPIVMADASAAAIADTGTVEASVAAHCAGIDAPADHDMPDPGMNCTAACAAFPALPPIIIESLEPAKLTLSIIPQKHLAAIALEGETPPPRMNPRI